MTLDKAIELLDHPSLRALASAPTRWADLGCGSGLFTVALSSFLAPGSTISAIDLHPTIVAQTTRNGVRIQPRMADFTKEDLHPGDLDGVLLANSLHYVRDQAAFLARINMTTTLLLVEYDTDRPVERWVPYPVSFALAGALLSAAGWAQIQKLGTRPSSFGRANLYAALASR